MIDKRSFEVYFLKKIPYLTNGLLTLFFISAVIFVILSAGISTIVASPEMKIFYLIQTSTVMLFYGSAFSTGLFLILYLFARLKKKALFIFNSDSFEVIFKKEKLELPFSYVRRIYCNDSENSRGKPSKYFTMTIENRNNKKILIRLRSTSDIEYFSDKLLSYDQLKIEYQYSNWAILD